MQSLLFQQASESPYVSHLGTQDLPLDWQYSVGHSDFDLLLKAWQPGFDGFPTFSQLHSALTNVPVSSQWPSFSGSWTPFSQEGAQAAQLSFFLKHWRPLSPPGTQHSDSKQEAPSAEQDTASDAVSSLERLTIPLLPVTCPLRGDAILVQMTSPTKTNTAAPAAALLCKILRGSATAGSRGKVPSSASPASTSGRRDRSDSKVGPIAGAAIYLVTG